MGESTKFQEDPKESEYDINRENTKNLRVPKRLRKNMRDQKRLRKDRKKSGRI